MVGGGSSTPLSGSEPMNMLMVDKPASETLLELLMICQPRKSLEKKEVVVSEILYTDNIQRYLHLELAERLPIRLVKNGFISDLSTFNLSHILSEYQHILFHRYKLL